MSRGLDISSEERGKMLFGLLGIEIAEGESENVSTRAGRILSDSGYRSRHPHLNPEAEPTLKDLRQSFPDLKIGLILECPAFVQDLRTDAPFVRHRHAL